MGKGKTKLADLDEIKGSFQDQKTNCDHLQDYKMDKLSENDIDEVTSDIWSVISGLKVGVGETKIVVGSKALHHLLPNLIPPIDGEYTLNFFYGNRGTALNQGDEVAFKEMYPYFCKISRRCKNNISKHLNNGLMATSKTKLIDNAIVGFRKSRK